MHFIDTSTASVRINEKRVFDICAYCVFQALELSCPHMGSTSMPGVKCNSIGHVDGAREMIMIFFYLYLFIYVFICLFILFICLFIYLCIMCLFIYLFIYLFIVHFIYLFIYLFIWYSTLATSDRYKLQDVVSQQQFISVFTRDSLKRHFKTIF